MIEEFAFMAYLKKKTDFIEKFGLAWHYGKNNYRHLVG